MKPHLWQYFQEPSVLLCLLVIPSPKTTVPLGVGSAFTPVVLQNGNLASNLRPPHLPVELALASSDSQNTKQLPLAFSGARPTCWLGFVFYSSASLRTITYMSRLPSVHSLQPRPSWIFAMLCPAPLHVPGFQILATLVWATLLPVMFQTW